MRRTWSELLWGVHAKWSYLLLATIAMLFTFLGAREIWTQEHRWADIVSAMFYYRDFFHPSLNGNDYYDKPLLSYWFIAFAVVLLGKFSAFALRLPSAFAGLLAVWSIYSLGTHLKDRRLGLLAGWMLLTTFYFIFWARTSSADMLNLAGTLFAVAWYWRTKAQPRFFDYVVFFLILAVTALCKGLIGPVVAVMVILLDLLLQNTWKKHVRFSVLLACIPAAILYFLPFFASMQSGMTHYHENGLMLVYRENILRYFQPFDHQGPLYTYLIFLPVYLFPWTLLFIPALFSLRSRWRTMSADSKWLVWVVLVLFLFFTLSGSRRNYYVLPIVPFAILMTADWILATVQSIPLDIWPGRMAVISFVLFFVVFDVVQPLYYAGGGMSHFAMNLKQETQHIRPWTQWNFVMLDPESKVRFYLALPPTVKNYTLQEGKRDQQTATKLLNAWPFLREANAQTNTIFISRQQYAAELRDILKNYTVVLAKPGLGERFRKNNPDLPIAFVPKNVEKLG